MLDSLVKLGQNEVVQYSTGKMVSLASLWESDKCVIVFFRRWGCLFCRVYAKQISELAPILKKHNVRLIGIGVDDVGIKDFMDRNLFDGEIYHDVDKKTYSALQFRRFNWPSIVLNLFTPQSLSTIWHGRQQRLGGDLRGDGLQNGGVLIVEKGGQLLYEFHQKGPAEHLSNETVLDVLKIEKPAETEGPGATIDEKKTVGEKEIECAEECTG